MARSATWTNSDGLVVGFGPRDSVNDVAGTVRTQGNEEMIIMELNAADMPTASGTARLATDVPIPANSYITKATLHVLTTFNDADANPTMTIGLVKSDGSVIDIDGLYAGLTELSGQLTAGAVVEGDVATYGGALVNGTASVGSSDAYITAALDTGAWDAGLARLTVWYLKPVPDSTPTDPISGIVGSL